MRPLLALICLLSLPIACDDAPASADDAGPGADASAGGPDAQRDAAQRDAAQRDAAQRDAAQRDAAQDGALLDAAPDAAPAVDATVDATVDAALPPPTEVVAGLEPQNINDFDEFDGVRLIDPGQSVHLAVALPPELAALETLALVVDAQVWRFEDGEVEVDFGAGPLPALLPGDGRGLPVTLRHRDLGPVAGPTGDFPVFLIPSAELHSITLTARGGLLGFGGARLMDPRRALPSPIPPIDGPPQEAELAVAPCGEGCDDGAALTAAIAAADPNEALVVRLAASRYVLRTPIAVRRSFVRIVGAGPETLFFWDPAAEAPRGAVLFTGRGRLGGALPIDASESGRRTFALAQAWPQAVHARLTSDDFGEIPPTCINGRDQEQRQRHLGQLARVLHVEPEGVRLSYPLNLAIPAAANPRIEPVDLLTHVGIEAVRFEANCPNALENPTFVRPECANPFVLGDAAVLFEWVTHGHVAGVEARAFGKFSVELSNTLDMRVRDYHMDHPSDYGEGGAGYAVHLITASQSVVHDVEVEHARHGVVIDFGSANSQVLDSHFANMPQALIDVHGEASRDSLVRRNTLQNAQLGVIVGGGGGVAHCNDGPRHHILGNTLAGITNSGITLFFESRQVFIRHNHIQGNLFGITVAFDSGEILAERNIFADTRIPVQLAGGGPVEVRGNVFADVCAPDRAVMALGGVVNVAPDNVYCPVP